MQLLHRRTVELILLLTHASLPHQVETVITSYLITNDDNERVANFEKFGVFWELSEALRDTLELSEAWPDTPTLFSRPMFFVLDLLGENATPADRRAGESWIRCHLRSYVRLVEPCMISMLDRGIKRRSKIKTVPYDHQILKDHQKDAIHVPYSIYLLPFDMQMVDYTLKTLCSLIKFGGVNVLKSCRDQQVDTAGEMRLLIKDALDMSIDGNCQGSLEGPLFIMSASRWPTNAFVFGTFGAHSIALFWKASLGRNYRMR